MIIGTSKLIKLLAVALALTNSVQPVAIKQKSVSHDDEVGGEMTEA